MPKKSNRAIDHWLFRKWTNIRQCVNNTQSPDYKYAGAKNCVIYWDNFWDFATWVEDNLGQPPKGKPRLCRINPDGDYAPGNLYWTNQFIHNNRGHSAVLLKYKNKELSIRDWSRQAKISYWTLIQRLNRGLTIAEALKK
jgi:hypothetical protein